MLLNNEKDKDFEVDIVRLVKKLASLSKPSKTF